MSGMKRRDDNRLIDLTEVDPGEVMSRKRTRDSE